MHFKGMFALSLFSSNNKEKCSLEQILPRLVFERVDKASPCCMSHFLSLAVLLETWQEPAASKEHETLPLVCVLHLYVGKGYTNYKHLSVPLALGFSEGSSSWVGLTLRRLKYRPVHHFGEQWPLRGVGLLSHVGSTSTMWVLPSGTWAVIRGESNSRGCTNAAKAPAKRHLWGPLDEQSPPHTCQRRWSRHGLWWPFMSESLVGQKKTSW